VAWPGPAQLAGEALGGALSISRTAAAIAGGTSAASARFALGMGRLAARAAGTATSTVTTTTATVLTGSTRTGYHAAADGARTAGRLLTGSRVADAQRERLADVIRAIFEPAQARRTRRIWATHGRVHVEVAAPVLEAPAVSRMLRHHLERLNGVEWATVDHAVGRVVVAFDVQQISVQEGRPCRRRPTRSPGRCRWRHR
jgi:cation-transporting P-type ATPase I